MHYAVCVKVEERVISSDTNYGWVKIPGLRPIPVPYVLTRIRVYWHVNLQKTVGIEGYAAKTFEGSPPPPIPQRKSDLGDGQYFGDPPPLDDLKQWLLSEMK